MSQLIESWSRMETRVYDNSYTDPQLVQVIRLFNRFITPYCLTKVSLLNRGLSHSACDSNGVLF